MDILSLDHLVLTVRDLDRTIAFYTQTLGMKEVSFGVGRKALIFGQQKINLHVAGQEFEPKADRPTPGSADLCFIAATSVDQLTAELKAAGVVIEVGPVSRTGARGEIKSVYIRDPDFNLIELSNYL